ncbi:FRG domain-containing protein [Leifsonia poae]|uniref:FRG domain-containing protein n=1 Tax=Leifsonia poae TaxID=110933 RepID=UPI003D69FA7D
MQHYGGPTRLHDVTANPLIAAWFAVESADADESVGARIFAFASKRSPVHLRGRWAERYPWWFQLRNDVERIAADWGTGKRVRSTAGSGRSNDGQVPAAPARCTR